MLKNGRLTHLIFKGLWTLLGGLLVLAPALGWTVPLSCLRVFSIQEIKVVRSLETEIQEVFLESYRIERARNSELRQWPIRTQEAPNACRVCALGARSAIEVLNNKVPEGDWTLVAVKGVHNLNLFPKELVQRYFGHIYVYSPKFNLIVDPTYSQFLVGQPQTVLTQHLKVFIGTPKEFAQSMEGLLSQRQMDGFLSAESLSTGPHSPHVYVDYGAHFRSGLHILQVNEIRAGEFRMQGGEAADLSSLLGHYWQPIAPGKADPLHPFRGLRGE